MSFTRADLLNNPALRAKLDPKDAQLLGLMTPLQAQTAGVELTNASRPESLTPSMPPTSSAKSKRHPPSKPELQSQAEFLHWIKKLNRSLPTDKPLLAIHADPTNPSGIIPGWPDFTIFHLAATPPLFIEFKRPRQGKLSPAQTLIHRYLTSLGHQLQVVFSAYAAIRITEVHFQLPAL